MYTNAANVAPNRQRCEKAEPDLCLFALGVHRRSLGRFGQITTAGVTFNDFICLPLGRGSTNLVPVELYAYFRDLT